ncbi:unnamed protein product, partial [Musa textilis]
SGQPSLFCAAGRGPNPLPFLIVSILRLDPILLGAAFIGADGDPDGTGDSDNVTLQVRCSNGSKFSVEAALDSTVGTLKAALLEKCDVPAEQQRLIYKGRILTDEQTLQSYGCTSRTREIERRAQGMK